MEEQKEGDVRVPLISSLFGICVVTGGIFLVLYAFVPDMSQPWFPIAALVLIGSPWLFWLMTYLYTCIKVCCHGTRVEDHQTSKRGHQTIHRTTTTTNTASAMARNVSRGDSPVNSPDGGRHVQFGTAVVMEGENEDKRGRNGPTAGHHEGGESSVASSKECEMPLTLSVSS
ncbi:hypothetical protein RJ639_023537 [Escallonia herrerae]|uniref:Uncharacterized protein n=1 Tax=Escallonia herrerae TaxID=1293975 RepID=A0AA88V0P2_9ASTE|nr:hypothetical protein RJ639_023537 [Escallonia herrerae]